MLFAFILPQSNGLGDEGKRDSSEDEILYSNTLIQFVSISTRDGSSAKMRLGWIGLRHLNLKTIDRVAIAIIRFRGCCEEIKNI